ncbi:hypothetical protein MTO96_043249 [Rhipicephalus appendiculatus]
MIGETKKKSGTEEEYSERNQLRQDILSLIEGTPYKVRAVRKPRKPCHGESSVQARKSAAAARDVHATRYAERSTDFIDECDAAEEEIDVASPTADATPAQLLTRMVTPDEDDREWDDIVTESAISIDRPASTEPQSAAPTHARSGDIAVTPARAGRNCAEPPRARIPSLQRLSPQQQGVGAPNRRILKPHQATTGVVDIFLFGKRQQEQADHDSLLERMKHEVIMEEKYMQMESRRLAFEDSKVAFEEKRLTCEKEQAMIMAHEREEDRKARAEERKEERRMRAEEKQEERREWAEERRLLAAQQEAFIGILQGLLPKNNMQ